MAGIPHDHFEPKTSGQRWLHSRLPVVGLLYDTLMLPTPKNLNWMWIWGIVLTFCLALQIITGIVLVMHYTPHVDMAFASIEHIMRNVNGGHMIRYLHMNGASLFFIAVYAHIFRGLYYGSYKAPREVTWIIGMLIYLLMMGTAFMGYVLPWGQMSFWGATVITGLFGAIPFIGEPIQTLLLGGPAVDNATLNRFFSLHYLFPFLIAGLVIVHIWAFHTTGNNNPMGVASGCAKAAPTVVVSPALSTAERRRAKLIKDPRFPFMFMVMVSNNRQLVGRQMDYHSGRTFRQPIRTLKTYAELTNSK